MLNDTPLKTKNYRRRALLMTVIAMVVVYILWNLPMFAPVLYPLNLFTTYVHEAGHAVATLLTGGRLIDFSVAFDGSGYITRAGGADWLIGPAGYLGAALFGSLLFFTINRFPRLCNPLAIALGIFLTLFTVIFAYGNLLALLLGVCFGMLVMALGLRAHPILTLLVLNILAVSTALEAFFDLYYLVTMINAKNGSMSNDAVQFSRRVTPLIPPSVIAVTWAGIAILMFGLALYYGTWRIIRDEVDTTYDNIRQCESIS